MGCNGVEIRNDIGPTFKDERLIWRTCIVCKGRVQIGDEVLYLFRQRGTQSGSSGYIHITCLPTIRLIQKIGQQTLVIGDTKIGVYVNRLKCVECGHKGCTHVGITKSGTKVGFHESCIQDERLSPEALERYRTKRKKVLRDSIIKNNIAHNIRDGLTDIRIYCRTRTRRSGKLVSAECSMNLYQRPREHNVAASHIKSAHMVLFSHCKWQRQKGELRLELLLNWPDALRKKVTAFLDELQDSYDRRGYRRNKPWTN